MKSGAYKREALIIYVKNNIILAYRMKPHESLEFLRNEKLS